MTNATKRITIDFDPAVHHALQLQAAEANCSISALVNDAVRRTLTEGAEDLSAFDERDAEPNLPFEDVVKGLKRSGKL